MQARLKPKDADICPSLDRNEQGKDTYIKILWMGYTKESIDKKV